MSADDARRSAAQDGPAPASGPGPDLARQALDRARENFAGRPKPTTRHRTAASTGRGGDPARLGDALADLLADRGWRDSVAAASVLARWADLVGTDVSGHSRAVSLSDGVLTVEAESTAWATQLRLLEPVLLGRIDAAVGSGVVRRLRVHGPLAPDWGHGSRRVRGRGPRDTYG
ncbi:MAG: DUF721 domain-containing protein [Mycobacteriales bacterium]